MLPCVARTRQHIRWYSFRRKDCQTNVVRSWLSKFRRRITLIKQRSCGINPVTLSEAEIRGQFFVQLKSDSNHGNHQVYQNAGRLQEFHECRPALAQELHSSEISF